MVMGVSAAFGVAGEQAKSSRSRTIKRVNEILIRLALVVATIKAGRFISTSFTNR